MSHVSPNDEIFASEEYGYTVTMMFRYHRKFKTWCDAKKIDLGQLLNNTLIDGTPSLEAVIEEEKRWAQTDTEIQKKKKCAKVLFQEVKKTISKNHLTYEDICIIPDALRYCFSELEEIVDKHFERIDRVKEFSTTMESFNSIGMTFVSMGEKIAMAVGNDLKDKSGQNKAKVSHLLAQMAQLEKDLHRVFLNAMKKYQTDPLQSNSLSGKHQELVDQLRNVKESASEYFGQFISGDASQDSNSQMAVDVESGNNNSNSIHTSSPLDKHLSTLENCLLWAKYYSDILRMMILDEPTEKSSLTDTVNRLSELYVLRRNVRILTEKTDVVIAKAEESMKTNDAAAAVLRNKISTVRVLLENVGVKASNHFKNESGFVDGIAKKTRNSNTTVYRFPSNGIHSDRNKHALKRVREDVDNGADEQKYKRQRYE